MGRANGGGALRARRGRLGSLLSIACAGVAGIAQGDASNSEASAAPADPALVSSVAAMSDDTAYGEYLAGECASCHAAGTSANDAAPVIHGRDHRELIAALLDYRSGARDNTTMGNVAGQLTDEDIAALAHYLASAGP